MVVSMVKLTWLALDPFSYAGIVSVVDFTQPRM
jgi:hypothetical protein